MMVRLEFDGDRDVEQFRRFSLAKDTVKVQSSSRRITFLFPPHVDLGCYTGSLVLTSRIASVSAI
jgi:hypothetical protein